MVADFCPIPIFSDFNLFDSRGPLLRQKYIIDVVAAILVVIEVMRRLLFLALGFREKAVVCTHNFTFCQELH